MPPIASLALASSIKMETIKKVYAECVSWGSTMDSYNSVYATLKDEGADCLKMEWLAQKDDGDTDVYMMLSLLQCPEVGVVYVLDYYGFRTNTWFHDAEETYHTYLPKTKECKTIFDSVKKALFRLTGLRMVFYNKGHYKASRAKMGETLMVCAGIFYHTMPKNCWVKIAQGLETSWMQLDLSRRMWRGKLEFIHSVIRGLLRGNYTYWHAIEPVFKWAAAEKTPAPDGWRVGQIYICDT